MFRRLKEVCEGGDKEVIWEAEGAVVKVPRVEREVRRQGVQDRLNCEGKEEGAKRVPLLDTRGTAKAVITEEKVRWLGIAGVYPGKEVWGFGGNLLQEGISAEAIEGIAEVNQEDGPLARRCVL